MGILFGMTQQEIEQIADQQHHQKAVKQFDDAMAQSLQIQEEDIIIDENPP